MIKVLYRLLRKFFILHKKFFKTCFTVNYVIGQSTSENYVIRQSTQGIYHINYNHSFMSQKFFSCIEQFFKTCFTVNYVIKTKHSAYV